jgi:hypothetical protein
MVNTELTITVTDAYGSTKTLDSQAPSPADRPRGIQFSTQTQSGFYTASFNLRRAIDRDNDDIHLGDDVKIRLGNGDTVYEGFVTALPRSTDAQSHTLSVSCSGWMAHAADTPFTCVFVDRDLGAWTGASKARQAVLMASSYGAPEAPTIATDALNSNAALVVRLTDTWTAARRPTAEAWYDAGPGNGIGLVYVDAANVGDASGADANYDLFVRTTSIDDASVIVANSGDIWPPPAPFAYLSSTSARYATITFVYNVLGTGGGANNVYSVHFRRPAVYGDHGLTLIGSSDPLGVSASDVIKYLANRYAPLLNTSGVQTTTYPISQLAFKESTKPYDAFLKVNSYHLWQLAVWENRTLYYEPVDLTDWDWEIRHDEVGNQIGLQGDELTSLRNGIIVQYTNAATGVTDVLMPADHPELRDDTIDNPYTAHGRSAYGDPFIVPFPTTAADALELGRLQLIEDNQPKAPGSFQVTGQIKDRAGNYQPVSKVRSGDRIRLTSSMNLSDRPRLIQETSYSHDGLTATISVDSTLRYLEGYLDRTMTALQAANLV